MGVKLNSFPQSQLLWHGPEDLIITTASNEDRDYKYKNILQVIKFVKMDYLKTKLHLSALRNKTKVLIKMHALRNIQSEFLP